MTLEPSHQPPRPGRAALVTALFAVLAILVAVFGS
jgi:hypothetical protein